MEVAFELAGTLRTKNVQPLSNFTLYVVQNQHNINTHTANNVTTVGGRNAFLAIIESYITNSSAGHPAGTITSSSITVNNSNGDIDINVLGTADNSATHFPGIFMTSETWDTKDAHAVAFKFLENGASEITICPDCQKTVLEYCNTPEFNLAVANGTYTAEVTDHTSGNAYTQTITVTDQIFIWNTAEPEGLFTPYSVYTLTLTDENGDPVTWVEGSSEYECIRFTFKTITNTNGDF